MKTLMMAVALVALAGCCCTKSAGVHPDTTAPGWRNLIGDASVPLEQVADFKPGTWSRYGKDGLTSTVDSALWFKGTFENFVLDFDYKLDPEANSGVIIYCSDLKNWIPNSVEVQLLDDHGEKWRNDPPRLKNGGLYGHCGPAKSNVKPAGEWNHMTVWAQGQKVKVAVNGEITVDDDLSRYTDAKINPDGTKSQPWLSKAMATLPTKGAIGLQGKHGGACPYFRNMKILELKK
ncbi:MAG: DUF1080 domain-containing protein [Kiritimatiellia bacterium]